MKRSSPEDLRTGSRSARSRRADAAHPTRRISREPSAATLESVLKRRRDDVEEESFSELVRGLPYVAVAGFFVGFLGSWVKHVEDVETVVDRLEFGVVCAGLFLVLVPMAFILKKVWRLM